MECGVERRVDCGLWSVGSEVWSMNSGAKSVEWEVGSQESRAQRVRVVECRAWRVKCGV